LKCLSQKRTSNYKYGTDSIDSVDYPDFGHPVANDVTEGKADLGIVICGRKRNCNDG
jgi:ribose 5-phosphate isomerase RpiB